MIKDTEQGQTQYADPRELQHQHTMKQFADVCQGTNCNASKASPYHSSECKAEHEACCNAVEPVSDAYKSEPVTSGFTACNIEYTKGLEAEIARLREDAQAVNTTLFSVIDEREKAEDTIARRTDDIAAFTKGIMSQAKEIVDLEVKCHQQAALLDEQKLSIMALNMCVGGEGSTTTENLTRVGRLEETIKQQAEEIARLTNEVELGRIVFNERKELCDKQAEQLAAAEKGAARSNRAYQQ